MHSLGVRLTISEEVKAEFTFRPCINGQITFIFLIILLINRNKRERELKFMSIFKQSKLSTSISSLHIVETKYDPISKQEDTNTLTRGAIRRQKSIQQVN